MSAANLPKPSKVSAREGIAWLRFSIQLFRLQWLRYCAITALFILILQFTALLSAGVLAMFLAPVLKVGFLAAAWHQERGEVLEVKHLFAGFKSNLKALLPLGLIYLLGMLLAYAIALLVSGIDPQMLTADKAKAEALPTSEVLQFVAVVLMVMLPVNAMLWFAGALIVFADAALMPALSRSLQACTQNLPAAVVYFVAYFAFAVLCMLPAIPVLILLGQNAFGVAVMMVIVPLVAVFMIGDYVSYRRLFHRTERLGNSA